MFKYVGEEGDLIESIDRTIPFPPVLLEAVSSVLQHDFVPLLYVDRLIRHLLAQHRDVLRFNRRLEHLRKVLNSLLQITLIILKQLLLIPLLQIIRHRIRPFERHPALLNLIHRLLHELHLDPRQLGRDLHLLHLLLGLGVELEGELGGLLVVRPAVVVVEVTLKRGAALGLSIAGVDAVLLVIAVARVPCRAMLHPRAHAHPAEFMFTFLACHMIAPPILLNRALAFTTLLRITLDPIRSLTIISTLLQPHLRHPTYNRSMIPFNRTTKAELMPGAPTRHSGHHGAQCRSGRGGRAGDRVCARGVRAVFQVGVGRDEIADDELLEARPGICVLGQHLLDERIRGDERAPLRHALDGDLALVADLARDVCAPA